MMSNNTYLRELLLFHVVPGLIGSIDDIYQDELVPTMLPGKYIRLNIYQLGLMLVRERGMMDVGTRDGRERGLLVMPHGREVEGVTGRITACGGPIIDAANCSNGVVHIISNVMHPVPPGDIMDVIDNDEQFSKLKELVYAAKLQDFLRGGPFTLFPPTNDAFRELHPGALEKYERNSTLLRELIKYHLLDWTLYASGSYDGDIMVTVQGEAINLTVWYDAIWINGYKNAMVTYQDYNVYNGVLHIINKVLFPPILWNKYK